MFNVRSKAGRKANNSLNFNESHNLICFDCFNYKNDIQNLNVYSFPEQSEMFCFVLPVITVMHHLL